MNGRNKSFKAVDARTFKELIFGILGQRHSSEMNQELTSKIPTQNKVKGSLSNCSLGAKDLVLIHFWATWCAPCLTDLPQLLKSYSDYQESLRSGNLQCAPKIELVLIAVESPSRQAESFFNQHPSLNSVTKINDSKGVSYQFFEVGKLPDNLLLDASLSQYRFLNFGTFQWSVDFFANGLSQLKMAKR